MKLVGQNPHITCVWTSADESSQPTSHLELPGNDELTRPR